MTSSTLALTRLHCFLLFCFFSPPSSQERLIVIYSWTKRLLNQQRWNRCFLTLLSPCSITLQQMRCQKKWIEVCFIAPLGPSANGFNYLTKIVFLWKSEKMIPQVSSGQVPNLKPRQANAQPITQHYFFKLAFISCSCLAAFPCSNKHKPGKIEFSDFIVTLPLFYSSLSLFFWVFWVLYKPILSLALQLWVSGWLLRSTFLDRSPAGLSLNTVALYS